MSALSSLPTRVRPGLEPSHLNGAELGTHELHDWMTHLVHDASDDAITARMQRNLDDRVALSSLTQDKLVHLDGTVLQRDAVGGERDQDRG